MLCTQVSTSYLLRSRSWPVTGGLCGVACGVYRLRSVLFAECIACGVYCQGNWWTMSISTANREPSFYFPCESRLVGLLAEYIQVGLLAEYIEEYGLPFWGTLISVPHRLPRLKSSATSTAFRSVKLQISSFACDYGNFRR